jgi:hypothetical protein
MKTWVVGLGLFLLATPVASHELTPTYPKLRPSIVNGLLSAKLNVFNARKDVDYYEIGVFSFDWKPVPFATTNKIVKVPHGTSYGFEVFVRERDRKSAVYICTLSKLRSDKAQNAIISSKVCSKVGGQPS